MSMTIALTGDVLQHGVVVLTTAGGDLAPTGADSPNLNLTLWSGIASFVTPLLVAVINQPRFSPTVRVIVTVLVSLAVGGVTAAAEGQLTGARWTTATLLVLSAAVFWYQTLLRTVAPAVETATSPPAARSEDPYRT